MAKITNVPEMNYKIKECGPYQAEIEQRGYKWFGIETKLVPEGIGIPIFEGKKFPQYNGITGNEEWIVKVIEFYKKKWNTDKFCVHGDLALCNIIFGDQIYIVDWEHFHLNDRKFFGFDIVNMLFIHLQYQYRWLSYLGFNWIPFVSAKHRRFITECLRFLGGTPFLRTPFTNGAWYIRKYINPEKFILGKQSPEILESLDILC
jgi:hypothetical protein